VKFVLESKLPVLQLNGKFNGILRVKIFEKFSNGNNIVENIPEFNVKWEKFKDFFLFVHL